MVALDDTPARRRLTRAALLFRAALGIGCLGVAAPAAAQEVRMGIRNDPSLDPQFMYMSPNVGMFRHIFGSLTAYDHDGTLQPADAVSWRLVDPTTWEFKLRPDIRLKSGGTLQADDVAFSFARVPEVANNPSSYSPTLQTISSVEMIDPLTVRIHTKVPNPYIPYNLAQTAVIPRHMSEGHGTGDFNNLSALDEYGPFRVVSFKQGDTLVLERNPTFWGEKPSWQRVTYRVMVNDASRMAALLSGDVDFVDFVPPSDAAKLRGAGRFSVHDGPSWRLVSLIVQVAPDAGGVKTPMRDVRVRRALSKAVDRQSLADRLMDGEAVPTSGIAISGMDGFDPAAPVEPYDPAGARALLAEAGYPSGFPISVVCSNGRYVNDAQVCQAVGQMMSRVGLRASVDAVPFAVLFNRMRAKEGAPGDFGLGMIGLGAMNPLPSDLYSIARTADPGLGLGVYNFGQFSNPTLDRLIDDGSHAMDPRQREATLRQAVALVREQVPVVPLYFQKVVTASRDGLIYSTNPNEETLAWRLRPK